MDKYTNKGRLSENQLVALKHHLSHVEFLM